MFYPLNYKDLVQPRGIEPLSTVLQTAAMTTSAKVAKLVLLTRIELVFHPYQGRVMPLYYKSKLLTIYLIVRRQQRRLLVPCDGFEPPTSHL